MTREEYQTVIKSIIAQSIVLMKNAKSDNEKLNIVQAQNAQIDQVTNAFLEQDK